MLAALPGFDLSERFRPRRALAGAVELPLSLTRVGRERAEVASTVEQFVAAAETRAHPLEIVDVPHGRHSFDMLDHDAESRHAVERALSWMTNAVRAGEAPVL